VHPTLASWVDLAWSRQPQTQFTFVLAPVALLLVTSADCMCSRRNSRKSRARDGSTRHVMHAMSAHVVRTCCFHRLHGLLLKSDLPEKVHMHVLVAAPHAQRAHGILDPHCISAYCQAPPRL
jgi:hypothetical protein